MGRSSGAARSLFESRDVRRDVDGAHARVLVDRDVVELGEGLILVGALCERRKQRGVRRGGGGGRWDGAVRAAAVTVLYM